MATRVSNHRRRCVRFAIRLTLNEHEIIKLRAYNMGLTVSEYFRTLMMCRPLIGLVDWTAICQLRRLGSQMIMARKAPLDVNREEMEALIAEIRETVALIQKGAREVDDG